VTSARIVPVGRKHRRRPGKKTDYLLAYKPDFPIAVVEAKAAPEIGKKAKPVAEQKAKPEPEKNAAALEQPLPLPRPSNAPTDKSHLSTAADATQQSPAPAVAARQTPRHFTRRRWRYYRWWW